MAQRILVVEDHDDLAFGLRRSLEFDGYTVERARDGAEGLTIALEARHDLLILDVMLPRLNGIALLEHLRAAGIETPVLVLTALGEERDTVRGLRAGADDYLAKPFGIAELTARVEALLRRSAASGSGGSRSETSIHAFGSIEVDPAARTVHRDGVEVSMAPKELDLLLALVRGGGTAQSRHELLRDVWGHKAKVATRTVDTHIAELRRKLETDPSSPRHIMTVRKHGYRFEP